MKKTIGEATATAATSRNHAGCIPVHPLNPTSRVTISARLNIERRRLSNIFQRPIVFTWFLTVSPRSFFTLFFSQPIICQSPRVQRW